MDDLFTLKGTLTGSAGKALPGLLVAIVDEDELDGDDLIGLGKTDAAGSFHLSFLGSEFRQDALEIEETPDLKIVVSTLIEGVFKPIFQRSFHVIRAILAAAAPEPVDPKDTKAAQYLEGREHYRKRQEGDMPARFQMDVSTLYGGAAFAPAAQAG